MSTTIGSMSAIKVMRARATLSCGLGGPDNLALKLFRHSSPLGSETYVCGMQSFLFCFHILERWNIKLTKRIYTDQLTSLIMPQVGSVAYIQARTCWLDDVVEEFVRRHAGSSRKVANIVILGAGFDTRCYRDNLNLKHRGVHTFEVDARGTQREKLKLLQKCGISHQGVIFVECDFSSQNWMDCLLQDGKLDISLPTLFVWEGVTMYLERQTIELTLKLVSNKCASGSCIAFDYLDPTWSMTPTFQHLTARSGEPWLFGATTNDAVEIVLSQGLNIWDHLHGPILRERYLPKRANGQPIGFLGDKFGGFIVAGKVN